MGRQRHLAFVIAALIPLLTAMGRYAANPSAPVTTVLLVRHAERDDGSLNEAGLERADELPRYDT